jgi:hypothetical protein
LYYIGSEKQGLAMRLGKGSFAFYREVIARNGLD